MTVLKLEMSDPDNYKDPAKVKARAERYASVKESWTRCTKNGCRSNPRAFE